MTVSANSKPIGETLVRAGDDYNDYRVPLTHPDWKGTIQRLKLDFTSQPGTTVTIDWIRIVE